jgi:DNA-binding response OmpR family regulator
MTWHILIAGPKHNRWNLLNTPEFEIIQVTGDNETWKTIQTQKPDLVLIQVGTSELNGEEIVRRIRADPRLAQIVIFCLGGPITTDELVQWFKLGIDDYIDDSPSMSLWVAQIKAHLRRSCPQSSPQAACGSQSTRRFL